MRVFRRRTRGALLAGLAVLAGCALPDPIEAPGPMRDEPAVRPGAADDGRSPARPIDGGGAEPDAGAPQTDAGVATGDDAGADLGPEVTFEDGALPGDVVPCGEGSCA